MKTTFIFINGVFVTLLVVFLINWKFENALYKRILSKIDYSNLAAEQQVLEIQNATYELLKPRNEFFSGKETLGFRDSYFRSADIQLIDGGACGTFVHVLGRLLQEADFDIRIAQMFCEGQFGCHIFLEVKLNDRYIVLDPLFNLSFRNPDGSLATFLELQENFSSFQHQLPLNYSEEYKYEDVRYTNWNKIPILMPFIKKLLGNSASFISVRSYLLNVYKVYFWIVVALWIMMLVAVALLMPSLKTKWNQ